MAVPIATAQQLAERQSQLHKERDPQRRAVAVCAGTGCVAQGSPELAEAFRREAAALGLEVDVRATGCHGFCEQGPLVVIFPSRVLYCRVTAADAREVLETSVAGQGIVDRLLYRDPVTGEKAVHEDDVPFYKHQQRLILGFNGRIDPMSLDDYIAEGGYRALARALSTMSREQVLEQIEAAQLRGRGGAGFPTGRKWRLCADQPGEPKYLVCNADEGDPGAFMDRSLLEGNPHGVIEGMLLGAYAMGASQGFVYVRHEYPLAVERLAKALEQAQDAGLLGSKILGSSLSFELEISRGAGAFVCGEETALLNSIMGLRGQPVVRPPYPTERGLWGQPTVINNVETWVNVPLIIDRGADWYGTIGTDGSKGTKIFSLVGKVNNTGLVEVPMGATLRHVIFNIGGGIKDGRTFKAVQTGGPSGGCLPEEQLDLPIDFDSLHAAGSMMGSGGMIVMDDRTCAVDVARYFVSFLIEESCGKCTPCREGLVQLGKLLGQVTRGEVQGSAETMLTRLEELAQAVGDGSLCQLGKTAANPVMSTLKYFRDEYLTHLQDQRCPAGVCRALIRYEINNNCTGCLLCKKKCPEGAITGERKALHTIDAEKCTRCGVCLTVCKDAAVEVL
jgi:NADH-quinone oxidoreductase subunit F